jgi:phosphonate transport system substrate-binding protein
MNSRLLLPAFLRLAGLVLCGAAPSVRGGTAASGDEVIRLGFTYAMFSGMNENDARASIKALAAAISRERGLPADPEPHLYHDTEATLAAIKGHAVNAIGVTAEEFWRLRQHVTFDGFVIGVTELGAYENYLVVVPASSPAWTLADLRNHSITMLTGPRMSVARDWLEVELARRGLPGIADFFGRRIESAKPSKVVLPVFFQQSDACLVNRRTFDAMVELNPQIARQVRVLATSPGYVPSLFVVAHGFAPAFLNHALAELSELHMTPAGQQVLTIFQTGQVSSLPEGTMGSTVALLDEHARLYPTRTARRGAPAATETPMARLAPPR